MCKLVHKSDKKAHFMGCNKEYQRTKVFISCVLQNSNHIDTYTNILSSLLTDINKIFLCMR